LLRAHGLRARVERYDEHSASRVRPALLAALGRGERLALISDAGTPLISDPGYRLVTEAIAQGAAVIPVPGPSAALAALTVSGLPTDRFLFVGFPPPRSLARRRVLGDLVSERASLIFFESGPRLAECLEDMANVFGPRAAAVARELTKIHETVIRGTLSALAGDPRLASPKGEMVIVVGGGEPSRAAPEEVDAALSGALRRLSAAGAAAEVARTLGLRRKEVYARALALKASPGSSR
ncbi:MAG: 16S rRNA (cytidine(1402)-2'-O)-methyltransferase, partial [Caulobacteraceae bacterium]